MADVRSLLRSERASRRINHPHASYTDSGKLQCVVCSLVIKTESLWDNHINSTQHTTRAAALRQNPPQTSQAKKRKAGDGEDEGRKRIKAVPGGFVPEGFFDDNQDESKPLDDDDNEDDDITTAPNEQNIAPDLTTPTAPVSAPAPASLPDVDEDEWAAFEREMAAAQQAPPTDTMASATISAAPITAEELAAQAREEQSAQRGAREAEMEADTEDANLALQQEFDEMEELDERVRRLREKREALRQQRQPDTLPDAPPPIPKAPDKKYSDGQDESDEDDEDDDFDDWTFGRQ